jgi:cell division protein FtsB
MQTMLKNQITSHEENYAVLEAENSNLRDKISELEE